MIIKCKLCEKEFEYPYLLERHKKRKTPCNVINEKFDCSLCNISFEHKSRLESHNTTKKHIKNYNIHVENMNITNNNNIVNNIIINNNITLIRGFSETNIEIISLYEFEKILANENKLHYYVNLLNQDPDDIYSDTNFMQYIFSFFIKIFEKLNFNLAFTENHNCNIFSFSKSSTTFIEYQLLEIDNTNKNYFKKCIDYKIFIDEFLNLMKKINQKFNNKIFDFILNYVFRYKKLLYDETLYTKHYIENELLTSYSIFEQSKLKVKTEEEEFQFALMSSRNNAFKHILG